MQHLISLSEAIEMVTRLKENPVAGLPVSETFDADIVQAILDVPGTISFRVYPGKKEDGSIVFIMLGADKDGNDQVDILGEDGFRCPPVCAPSSLLYL